MMQVYVTPLGEEETCVALISDNPRMRLEDAWSELPELAARVRMQIREAQIEAE